MCRPIESIHFRCLCTITNPTSQQPVAYHPCRAASITRTFCTTTSTDRHSPTSTLRVPSLQPYYGREPYFPLSCQEALMHDACARVVYASVADWAAEAKMYLSYGYMEVLECLLRHQAFGSDDDDDDEDEEKMSKRRGAGAGGDDKFFGRGGKKQVHKKERPIVQLARKILRKSGGGGVAVIGTNGRRLGGKEDDEEMQALVRRREQRAIAAANVNIRAQGLELVRPPEQEEEKKEVEKKEEKGVEKQEVEKKCMERGQVVEVTIVEQKGVQRKLAACWEPLEDIGRTMHIGSAVHVESL